MSGIWKRLSMYFHGKSGMLIVNVHVERLKSTFKPIYTPISFNTRSVVSSISEWRWFLPLSQREVDSHMSKKTTKPLHNFVIFGKKNHFFLSQSHYSPPYVFYLSSSSPQHSPPSLSRLALYCCLKDMKLQITKLQSQFDN